MPPKKATKLKEKLPADPVIDPTAIPPALPPSVEEAYRRKCVQLKQRTNEVEEENDATRIRLARIRRQIEKMRVERAFLLEQLTRRTSTNVEDSDGSPSPPPTPKDKPLRTKRGHRKPSMLADLEASMKSAASPFVSQNLATLSPSSEAFSHTQASTAVAARRETTNGLPKPPKKPADAFDLYCEEARPELLKKRDDQGEEEEANVEEELSQAWKDLPDDEREAFQTKHDDLMAEYNKKLAAYNAAKEADAKAASPEKEPESTEEPAAKEPSKERKDEDEDKPKDEAKDAAKEDEEMKDSDKDDKVEPESSAPPAAETQDEDVEMGDPDSEAQPEEKKASEKAD